MAKSRSESRSGMIGYVIVVAVGLAAGAFASMNLTKRALCKKCKDDASYNVCTDFKCNQ